MGITPREFWDELDIADLSDMMNGYRLKEKYEFNLHTQNMAVMRWVGTLIHNANVKPIHRKQPHQLLPLPGENIPQKPLITKDQLLNARHEWDRIELKRHGS